MDAVKQFIMQWKEQSCMFTLNESLCLWTLKVMFFYLSNLFTSPGFCSQIWGSKVKINLLCKLRVSRFKKQREILHMSLIHLQWTVWCDPRCHVLALLCKKHQFLLMLLSWFNSSVSKAISHVFLWLRWLAQKVVCAKMAAGRSHVSERSCTSQSSAV